MLSPPPDATVTRGSLPQPRCSSRDDTRLRMFRFHQSRCLYMWWRKKLPDAGIVLRGCVSQSQARILCISRRMVKLADRRPVLTLPYAQSAAVTYGDYLLFRRRKDSPRSAAKPWLGRVMSLRYWGCLSRQTTSAYFVHVVIHCWHRNERDTCSAVTLGEGTWRGSAARAPQSSIIHSAMPQRNSDRRLLRLINTPTAAAAIEPDIMSNLPFACQMFRSASPD